MTTRSLFLGLSLLTVSVTAFPHGGHEHPSGGGGGAPTVSAPAEAPPSSLSSDFFNGPSQGGESGGGRAPASQDGVMYFAAPTTLNAPAPVARPHGAHKW